MFPNFVTAPLSSSDLELTQLFLSVQTLIQSLLCSFYITHIHAHSALPGPLTAGNNKVDKLISALFSSPKEEHELLHTNANHLHGHYHISLSAAHDIVRSCSVCSPLHQRMSPSGANPRGLHPNELWQADFTHFSLPGTSLLFVVVDTHSGFIWAVPASSESTKAAIQSLFSAFSVMGLPHTLKTDNGPAFTSKGFSAFLSDWNILHLRGIPYDPQGQAIIERAHRTLKLTLNKLKEGALYTKYGPKGYLPLTLFTIFFFEQIFRKDD